ncbi:P-loop containing nucleoside triphosphate hydrolase protein, partial [Hyaloscypha finlandica]
IIISRPYRCLFFLREEIQRRAESSVDDVPPKLKRELKILLDFINSDDGLKKVIKSYNELIPQKKITFDLLWTIYPPFELVYDLDNIRGRLFMIEYTQIERVNTLVLAFSLLGASHTGKDFGIHRKVYKVEAFRGVVTITSTDLHIVPLRFLSESKQSEIKMKLLELGKLYVKLQRSKYTLLHHDGPVQATKQDGGRLLTAGRVVVDVKAAAESRLGETHTFIAKNLEKLKESTRQVQSTTSSNDEAKDLTGMTSSLSEEDLKSVLPSLTLDHISDSIVSNDVRTVGVYNAVGGEEEIQLSDEDYMICQPWVLAFLLDKKIWVKLYVQNLSEIAWRTSPFDFLELEAEKKGMVKDLVENYDSEEAFEGFDDIVQGKGKGLIFLLHGEPGLGKTLTAETIAEHTKRALYYLTTGELDLTDVTKMEDQLQRAFRMGWRWGAVVLIDEADVIMSRRSTTELARNAIVAVFLRLMEYYKGLLFLTTNRIDDFDNAFHNRIHVTIKYENLTIESRTNIWRSLLRRLSDSVDLDDTWSEEAVEILGHLDINGRDVRNLIRTA